MLLLLSRLEILISVSRTNSMVITYTDTADLDLNIGFSLETLKILFCDTLITHDWDTLIGNDRLVSTRHIALSSGLLEDGRLI